MKKYLSILTTAIALLSQSYADTPIRLDEIPEAVAKTIEEYFPGSKAISAERDKERGIVEYEVIIQYKDIRLEVELTPEGKIVDVDMD